MLATLAQIGRALNTKLIQLQLNSAVLKLRKKSDVSCLCVLIGWSQSVTQMLATLTLIGWALNTKLIQLQAVDISLTQIKFSQSRSESQWILVTDWYLVLYRLCLWSDWFYGLTWQKVYIYMRRVLKCAFAYDLSLTVLRWPSVVDRTLQSNY